MHVGHAGSRVYRLPGAALLPIKSLQAKNTERFRSQSLQPPNGASSTRADASRTAIAAYNAEQGRPLAARACCAAPLQPAAMDPAASVVQDGPSDDADGAAQQSSPPHPMGLSATDSSSGSSGSNGNSAQTGPELTRAIVGCTTFRELWRLFEANASRLNATNMAALACRIAKVTNPARLTQEQRGDLKAALFEISTVAEELLPSARPRDLALLAAGLARAGARDRRLMQLLLPRCPLDTLRPPELVQVAWAVAKSGFDPPPDWVHELLAVSMRRMRTMARLARMHNGNSSNSWRGPDAALKPCELASLAWSIAVLQRRCLLSSSSAAGTGAPAIACARIPRAWFLRLQRAVLDSLPRLGAAEVSILLWSLAALGHQPPRRWLEAVAARAAEVAGAMEERHVAAVAWAVSHMQQAATTAAAVAASEDGGMQDSSTEQLPAKLSSSGRNLDGGRTSDEQQGSGSRQDVGQQGTKTDVGLSAPAATALAAALQRRTLGLLPSMHRPVLNCTLVLSAFARMGLPPPPDFMQAVLMRVQTALLQPATKAGLGSQGLVMAVSASSPQAVGSPLRPPQEQQQHQQQQSDSTVADDRRAAAVATLLAHQAVLAARAEAAARARQRGWGPRDLATLAWALAAVGYRPSDAWVTAVLGATRGALREFGGRELSLLLYSWARLGAPPPPLPLAAAGARAALRPGVVATLDALGASQLLYALGRWSYRAARAAAMSTAATCATPPGGPEPSSVAVAATPATASSAGAYRMSPAEVAALLALFLRRIDDAVEGTAPAMASVVHSLPWAVAPSRLRSLPAAPAADGRLSGAALLDRLARAARERLGACGPPEVSQIALGFARLGHDPGAEWAEAVTARAAQLATAPGCDDWGRGQMAHALSALNNMRARRPRLQGGAMADSSNGAVSSSSSVEDEMSVEAAVFGSPERARVLV